MTSESPDSGAASSSESGADSGAESGGPVGVDSDIDSAKGVLNGKDKLLKKVVIQSPSKKRSRNISWSSANVGILNGSKMNFVQEASVMDVGDELDGLKIKKIKIDRKYQWPMASFCSLGIPRGAKLDGARAGLFDINPAFLEPNESHMKKILAVEVPLPVKDGENPKTMRYEGTTPFLNPPSSNSYAAVIDTKTGEAVCYPAEIYHMMPCVEGFGDHPWRLRMDFDDEKKTVADEEVAKKTKYTELSSAFGTSKKKRREQMVGANRVEAGSQNVNDLSTTIDKVATEAAKNVTKKAIIPGDDFDLLPLINLTAQKWTEVYDIDDVIPPSLKNQLLATPEAQAIWKKDAEGIEEWRANGIPGFVDEAMKEFSKDDDDLRANEVRNVFFAYILITLHGRKSDSIRKKNADFPQSWPASLLNHFFLQFTQESLSGDGKRRFRIMPQLLKDKALIHALIVMVVHNHGRFNADKFLQEIKISTEKLQSLCRLARLTISARSGVTWVELSVPLPEWKEEKKLDRKKRKR